VRHNLVQALVAQRRGAEAEPYLRQLVELRPDDLRGRLTLGNVLLDSNRLGEAEQEFEIAVRHHPEPANGWFLLGEARRLRGAWREAIVAYEAAAAREPGMREAQRRLAECYGQVGERDKAALAAARAAGS
jgi:predicted Zn-dependent protease